MYVYGDYPGPSDDLGGTIPHQYCSLERTVEVIRVTSEDKVERMENLLRKVLTDVPPCDGKKTESRRSFLQKWIQRRNSTPFRRSQKTLRVCYLTALIHSLSLEEPDAGDRDHTMERKLQEYVLGYQYPCKVKLSSSRSRSHRCQLGTLFNITSFTSLRPEFWNLRP